jgi:hypothetical protein
MSKYIPIQVQNRAVVSKQTFQNKSFLNILKKYYPADELTLSWPAGHIFSAYKESFQVSWDNMQWYCMQCCYAALHTVSFVHGCFAGKCILTVSTEYRYFKVDGNMEKKWDTVIPADLKRLFVSGTYMSRWSRKG